MQFDALQRGSLSDLGAVSTGAICTSLFQLTGEVLLGSLSFGLYRTLRKLALEGPGAAGSALDVLKRAAHRYAHLVGAFMLMLVAVFVGALACGVGALVAAFFVFLAPYLVSAREQEVVESFKTSFEAAKANATTLIVAMAVSVVTVLIMFGIGAGLGALMTSVFGAVGVFLSSGLGFLIGSVVGFVLFVYVASVAVTIDLGRPLTR